MQIPTPCHKKWDDLDGTDQIKYCALCKTSVYNISNLSENQVFELVKGKEKVCGMMVKKHQSVSYATKLRLSIVGFGLFVANVFGQQDSIQIKGIVNDANGLPIKDSKITLKDYPIESFSNENGEFELKVPSNLGTYIFIAQETEDFKIDVVFKEEQLKELLIIPLKQSNEIIIGSVVIESYKPTFKQRVINTITWPYRKIRSTFFDD